MTFFRSMLLVCPAACLLAQTPPSPPPNSTPASPASLAPQPSVKITQMPPAPPSVDPDKVVLTAGNQKVTAAQYEQIVSALPQQYQASARGGGRRQFADNLVRILLLSQEGKRRKLDEGAQFRTQVMFQEANILAGLTYEQMGKEVKVDDAEVRKYYEEHKKDLDEAHARHILIRMQGSPVPVKPGQKDLTEAEALAKAQELFKKLAAGGDFAALAQEESDDTGSAARGGDLGFFHVNQMVPAFAEAAFKMKPGELSEPLKTQFGYHIIKLEEVKSFAELRPEIETRMRPEMASKALEELQKKGGVELDSTFFGPPSAPPAPMASVPSPK